MLDKIDKSLFLAPTDPCPFCAGPITIQGVCSKCGEHGLALREGGYILVYTKISVAEEILAPVRENATRVTHPHNNPPCPCCGRLICTFDTTESLAETGLCRSCYWDSTHRGYTYIHRRPTVQETLATPVALWADADRMNMQRLVDHGVATLTAS